MCVYICVCVCMYLDWDKPCGLRLIYVVFGTSDKYRVDAARIFQKFEMIMMIHCFKSMFMFIEVIRNRDRHILGWLIFFLELGGVGLEEVAACVTLDGVDTWLSTCFFDLNIWTKLHWFGSWASLIEQSTDVARGRRPHLVGRPAGQPTVGSEQFWTWPGAGLGGVFFSL